MQQFTGIYIAEHKTIDATNLDTIAYLNSLGHEVTEVRILRESPYLQVDGKARGEFVGNTVFGYYDNQNYEKLVADIQPYENDPETYGIYTTIQRCEPSLLARSANRLKQSGKNSTTSDDNITHFVVFPIDIDSGHASGISATNAELEASKQIAGQIADALQSLDIPVVKAKSGNGWHILIYLATPLAVTEKTTIRFKRCGDIIGSKYGGDATVYNPARIWKLYGTTAKKGDSTPDRPHRQAKILDPADLSSIKRISFDDLEKAILSLSPTEPTTTKPDTQSAQNPPARRTHGKRLPALNSRDDLERLARDCGVTELQDWQQKPDYEVSKTNCPLCKRDGCGFITYSASGECGFKCHTNTCSGKNLQSLYESAGYTKAPEQPNGNPPKVKAEVKTENTDAESEAAALDTPAALETPENPFFESKKFLPLGMVSYLESTGLHTLSLEHENFIRVYRDGIYRKQQGEILHSMKAALGERVFKMSQYNEVIDYLQVDITPFEDCEQTGYLNLKNGFLNLETLELEKHTPERKSIVQLPIDFDPSANPTKIEAWLTDCLYGDKEQETLFYEAVGYTLLQTTEMQKMFFLLGRTQTGKSTAAHILKGLIGKENYEAFELASLDNEDNRFSRANLTDKIANFSCDISPKYLTGDGNIKKLVSGDAITGEFKFRSPFTFESTCTLWAMANALPPSGDKSDAWYERFVILKFDKQFLANGENKPDRTLKHTLTEPSELSGLLNVALICGKELLTRGHFTESKKNAEAVENYKFLNDHVLKFITESADTLPYGDVDFYDTYKVWCEREGEQKPLSKTKLADATQKHGISRIRKGADGNRHFAWVKTQKC